MNVREKGEGKGGREKGVNEVRRGGECGGEGGGEIGEEVRGMRERRRGRGKKEMRDKT